MNPTELPNDNEWHLRKEINLTHIAATVTVIVSLTAGYYDLLSDVEVVTTKLTATTERLDRNDRRLEGFMEEVKNYLRRIDEKLDRKQDR